MSITPEQLAEWKAATTKRFDEAQTPLRDIVNIAFSAVPALVAEVERLRALLCMDAEPSCVETEIEDP